MNRSFLCQKEEESTEHLLILCDLTRDLWHFLFSLFGVHWVLPSTVKRVLLSLHGSFVGSGKDVTSFQNNLNYFSNKYC